MSDEQAAGQTHAGRNVTPTRAGARHLARLASAIRYLSTYAVLIQHFAVSTGPLFALMIAGVMLNALLHPVPFLLAAELLRGTEGAAGTVALGWHPWMVSVRTERAVLLVALLGSTIVLLTYLIGRLVSRTTIAWQSTLFWPLMAGIPRISRWDSMLDLGVVLQPAAVATRIETGLRGAFLIARLIETGLRDLMMIAALLALLLWLDATSMVVLVLLSLLFLPAYAVAIISVVNGQAKSGASLQRLRQPLRDLVAGELTRATGRRLDARSAPRQATRVMAQSFGSQSLLLVEQNAVSAVAGLHLFVAFYGVYLADASRFVGMPASRLSFFFFLLLMLRSLANFVQLLSRLSRGYDRLALLRSLLWPGGKRPTSAAAQPPAFTLQAVPGYAHDFGRHLAAAGTLIVFVAPAVHYAFQLLPLANVMQPQFQPRSDVVRFIPLLGEPEVPVLVAGGVLAAEAQSVRLPLIGALPFVPDPVDLARTPVVALTPRAWQKLRRLKGVAGANAGRILVVACTPSSIPVELPDTTITVLSDGRRAIAAGTLAAIRTRLADPSAPVVATGAEDEDTGDEA